MRHQTNNPGVAGSTCQFESLESRQLMSGGSIDTTFGAGGKLAPAVGFVAQDVAVQPDGKTVLVGELNDNFAIARLNLNGTRDLGFGRNGTGIVTLHFDDDAAADRVLIQPDGKILIGGHSDGFLNNHLAFGRLRSDGHLDKTFSGDGITTALSNAKLDGLNDMALQPDGRIVFVTSQSDLHFSSAKVESDIVLGRLRSDGELDHSFGLHDPISKSNRRVGYNISAFGGHDFASAVVIQPNGKIVVGGTKRGDELGSHAPHEFLVGRFNADGLEDKTFDGNGKLATPFKRQGGGELRDIVVQSDGKIVAAGSTGAGFTLVRYNLDGSLDKTFDDNGIVFTKLSDQSDVPAGVFLDSKNAITVVGTAGAKQFAAVRYNTNGSLDKSFAARGVARFDTGGFISGISAALAPDDRIIITGRQDNATELVRFNWHHEVAKISDAHFGQALIR